jgi:lysophospholipase L1-like esterase
MTDSFAFGACSGAIIDDLYKSDDDVWALNSPTPDEPAKDVAAQLPGQLGPGTQMVTLSIGGNDAGFVPLVSDCVYNKNFACFGA